VLGGSHLGIQCVTIPNGCRPFFGMDTLRQFLPVKPQNFICFGFFSWEDYQCGDKGVLLANNAMLFAF
jgi:hypothetical protein